MTNKLNIADLDIQDVIERDDLDFGGSLKLKKAVSQIPPEEEIKELGETRKKVSAWFPV